jgi:8-oxo-dGTP diphosphatase
VNELLARFWRLGKPLQWRFLWAVHAKFICGVIAGRLLKVSSGYRYRIEVYYEATLIGGLDRLRLDPREVLEARLFRPDDLPAGMPQAHRELVVTP